MRGLIWKIRFCILYRILLTLIKVCDEAQSSFLFLLGYHCDLVLFALSPFFFFIHSLLNLLYDTLHSLYIFIFDCIKEVQLGILEGKAKMDGFEFIHLVIIQHIVSDQYLEEIW